jgi:hypothetical protein
MNASKQSHHPKANRPKQRKENTISIVCICVYMIHTVVISVPFQTIYTFERLLQEMSEISPLL